MSTSYSDPYTLARQFGSIDMISGGRAAWNAVTSPLEGSGRNYSRAHPDHALRYKIADEYLEVVTKLWDSWDDDAFIRDVKSGRFMDPAKMHRLDHHGQFFDVEGPLNIARSPQGQPLIFQAGASDAGIELAAKYADCVFTNGGTLEKAQTFYRKVKDAARAHGRNPDHIKIFPGTGPSSGPPRKPPGTPSRIRPASHDRGRAQLSQPLLPAARLHGLPAGRTLPRSRRSRQGRLPLHIRGDFPHRRERGLTLREVAVETATLRAHIGTSETFTGSAERIAGEMIRWIDEGAADGLHAGLPGARLRLDDFVDLVLPILAERGYHDMQTQGTTLRDHFGLPYRESVYAHSGRRGGGGTGAGHGRPLEQVASRSDRSGRNRLGHATEPGSAQSDPGPGSRKFGSSPCPCDLLPPDRPFPPTQLVLVLREQHNPAIPGEEWPVADTHATDRQHDDATRTPFGKDVILRVRAEIDTMPDALSRIGKYIVDNPEKAVRSSVAELALHSTSGEASVVRFCRHLGYDGFRDLKLGARRRYRLPGPRARRPRR